MDEIVLRLRVEGKALRKIKEASVDLLEIPGIVELDKMGLDAGLRRYGGNVRDHEAREIGMLGTVQKHEAVDPEVLMHAQADSRPPFVPARGIALAAVQRAAQKSDHRRACHGYTVG
jgi:hypothetical protein